MQTFRSSFDRDIHGRALGLELRHADARQLLDIGLVRAADGSLRLAEDPSLPVGPDRQRRVLKALYAALEGVPRWLRGLPLRSPDWRPHFFLRE